MPQTKDTSEDSTATTLSEGIARSLVLKDILDAQTAIDILKRTLSVGTVTSTTSSFAERMNGARFDAVNSHSLRDIGRGSCGSVFEIPGSPFAIKKGADAAAIWNDFNLTNHAYNSYLTSLGLLEYVFPGRRIPRVPMTRYFNGPDSAEFWAANITRFPAGDQTRAAVFNIDRILPVPDPTRQALVRQFFRSDTETQLAVLNNPENKDCLVRVYFGQNDPSIQQYDRNDTLRNFPLYLDQAKSIGLDIDGYAEEMAIGLAILHWKAGIDAQDTEFVIGTSTTKTFGTVYENHGSVQRPMSTMDDYTQRQTQLWMLDYDKCTKVDLEAKDGALKIVERYFVAVTGNDPYFPHPRLDVGLWQKFRKIYLRTSEVIIKSRRLSRQVATFPGMLIERWEKWGKMDAEAEEFDPFERSTEDEDEEDDEDEDEDDDDDDDEEETESDDGSQEDESEEDADEDDEGR